MPNCAARFKENTMASAANPDPTALRLLRSSFLASLERTVSPPPRAQSQQCSTLPEIIDLVSDDEGVAPKRKKQRLEPPAATSTKPLPNSVPARSAQKDGMRRIIPSPFQLTRIADLPDGDNIAAVTLHDLLGSTLLFRAASLADFPPSSTLTFFRSLDQRSMDLQLLLRRGFHDATLRRGYSRCSLGQDHTWVLEERRQEQALH